MRGLAQRSAEAAKESKALISASTVQVENGVTLVDKTGLALKDIILKVAEMDRLVQSISFSSREQATGLAEINTAVTQMDRVVQQNAAMVEESTAAAHALKAETQDLTTMVGRFRLGVPPGVSIQCMPRGNTCEWLHGGETTPYAESKRIGRAQASRRRDDWGEL